MENYKLINVQLMNQVQSQRIMIRQLREEEVKLRRNWMEEREKRLAEAIFYENKLKCAIRTLLSSLGINLDFNANSASPPASQASGSEDNRSNRSNSNRISSEFRASSVLLQNSVPISPSNRNRGPSVRRSSVNALDDCSSEVTNNPSDAGEEIIHLETPEPRHLHELQGYTSSPSSPEAEGAQEDKTRSSQKKRTPREKSVVPENGIDCENLEPTIEYVRHATQQISPIQPFPGTSVGSYFSPSSSQLNFERPGNCISQEPETLPTKRKAGGKRTKTTVNSTRESGEQSSSNESTLNGRPSRKCRPKSLKEPSIR